MREINLWPVEDFRDFKRLCGARGGEVSGLKMGGKYPLRYGKIRLCARGFADTAAGILAY